MQALVLVAVTFGLLWVLFIWPQQRRVRAHQQLIATLQEGDEVVLTAGIFGRINTLGPEEMTVQVAPAVELRVARMAVLRRVEHVVAIDDEDELTASEEPIDPPEPYEAHEPNDED
jgi:preprotein translocase subunit YajC